METLSSIPAVFTDKNVFITGASGFLGKILVEKLLRSCPNIGDVYLLLREKTGKTLEERMKEITDLPVSIKIIFFRCLFIYILFFFYLFFFTIQLVESTGTIIFRYLTNYVKQILTLSTN